MTAVEDNLEVEESSHCRRSGMDLIASPLAPQLTYIIPEPALQCQSSLRGCPHLSSNKYNRK
jgi:hypothetical protein